MTRVLTRTHLHSSRLIRTLSDLAVLPLGESTHGVAEKLGLWINLTDAITLSAVHNVSSVAAHAQANVRNSARATIAQEFDSIRRALERGMMQPDVPSAGRGRIALPAPQEGMSVDEASAYSPYRRYHVAHQRHMEQSARALRAKVREVVATASPKLRQLAALDAAFENALDEREAQLLSTIPTLMEKRFRKLYTSHQELLAKQQQPDTPELWMKPGAWLVRFLHELHTALLAELDLRLQPSVGLLEALNSDRSTQL